MKKVMYFLFMILMGGLTGLLLSSVTMYILGLFVQNLIVIWIGGLATYPLTFLLCHKEAVYFAEMFF